MKKSYTTTKIWIYIVWIVVSLICVPALLYSLFTQKILMAMLFAFMEICFLAVGYGLLHYYGNVVTGVSFADDMTIIETNVEDYRLPSENFYEVVDSYSMGRIFLKYADEHGKRIFIFQKHYSPIHQYSLDMQELRENMLRAKFTKN